MAKMAVLSSLLGIFIVASATDLHSQSPEAAAASYLKLGDEFAGNGEFKLAIGAYTVALDYVPSFAAAYVRRLEQGKVDEARRHFKRLISLRPSVKGIIETHIAAGPR